MYLKIVCTTPCTASIRIYRCRPSKIKPCEAKGSKGKQRHTEHASGRKKKTQWAPATVKRWTAKVNGGHGSYATLSFDHCNRINCRFRCWWAWWTWWGAQWACPGGHCPGGCLCRAGEACAAPGARWGRWTRSPDPGRCPRSCSCCRSVGHSREEVRKERRKQKDKRQ